MVVTSGTREAVEPVASAGLPLAGRTESVEEAGVGTDAARNAQGVLNYIAHRYFQTVDTTQPEERNEFLRYLEDVRKVLVLDPKSGSLIVTVLCTSLEILDALWCDYCTGHLNNAVAWGGAGGARAPPIKISRRSIPPDSLKLRDFGARGGPPQ